MEKVTAAVIERNGKILIAKRKRSQKLGGKWEFPGGKLEPGETPEECLKRELLEELGIEAVIDHYLCANTFAYRHLTIKLLAYRVSRFSGKTAYQRSSGRRLFITFQCHHRSCQEPT